MILCSLLDLMLREAFNGRGRIDWERLSVVFPFPVIAFYPEPLFPQFRHLRFSFFSTQFFFFQEGGFIQNASLGSSYRQEVTFIAFSGGFLISSHSIFFSLSLFGFQWSVLFFSSQHLKPTVSYLISSLPHIDV